jgi:hypothetical protein
MKVSNAMKIIKLNVIIINIVMCMTLFMKISLAYSSVTDLYFPPMIGKWETVPLEETGWDASKLDLAIKYAGEQKSSGEWGQTLNSE